MAVGVGLQGPLLLPALEEPVFVGLCLCGHGQSEL